MHFGALLLVTTWQIRNLGGHWSQDKTVEYFYMGAKIHLVEEYKHLRLPSQGLQRKAFLSRFARAAVLRFPKDHQ